MATTAKEKPKLNKPLGRIPTMQFCRPEELRIDPSYQRDIAGEQSQSLIRRIAQGWNWDLCLPLVVARRQDIIERLFVIDGQHRLAAARLRGDIDQLPCVILNYETAAQEAASFVALNQQRKPLSKIDLFKAAVASGNEQALGIFAAIERAGLGIAPHTNPTAWKPMQVSNIAGIERTWQQHGADTTEKALTALARGFDGQVLQYAGTLFPGIVAICVNEAREVRPLEGRSFDLLTNMLSLRTQTDWRDAILEVRHDDPNLNYAAASARAFLVAWNKARAGHQLPMSAPASPNTRPTAVQKPAPVRPTPAPAAPKTAITADALAPRWCNQCEQRVSALKVAGCASRFCSLKLRA